MKILAIETSCDETAVSILEAKGSVKNSVFDILSNVVASQVKVHAPWGGVVPNLAKREHRKNLPLVLKKALKEAKLSANPPAGGPKIDLIAVTSGPGLEPALWVGINFAQELAKRWNKPLIGINHLEGHIFSVLLRENREISNLKSLPCRQAGQISKIKFPALALVVSGGHTELVLMDKFLKYKILGQTLDDAAGEAFDKVAKMLGLGYPGGPVVAKMAAEYSDIGCPADIRCLQIKFPRPMLNSKDYNFSFSGLKTSVLYKIRDLGGLNQALKGEICYEFQQAAIDVLVKKTMAAAKDYRAKTIMLGGGVAANKELRKQMAEAVKILQIPQNSQSKKMRIKCDRSYGASFTSSVPFVASSPIFLLPEIKFTGDNAAMIALAAYFRFIKNKKIGDGHDIVADSNLQL